MCVTVALGRVYVVVGSLVNAEHGRLSAGTLPLGGVASWCGLVIVRAAHYL